ncbi:hypothetical protein MTR67_047236 [Solanum verrucosum]|uniref:Agenet domain-containing protein n=3 Tax=Solanum verrucosum TaxID=315347 RepID=A0AAF0ZWC1_SOLVR|nr:hypothetical protein MTR67_047236 [Solanum verrucosum]
MPRTTFEVLTHWQGIGKRGSKEDWWKNIPACIWWTLWKERNGRCFEGKVLFSCLFSFPILSYLMMDTDSHVFSSWEEHVVSQGKGRRVVHYYLKDTSGELILAVVGTEESSKNMLYVVSEDYLDAFGHTSTINSDTKWRTRKGVVEWLTVLISKHHQSPPISSQLALKLGGGGKGVEGLPKTVSLSLRGRVKDGVVLHCKIDFLYVVDTPRRETRRSALMAGHISDEVSQNITRENPATQGPRGSRSVGESDHSGIRKSIPGNQIAQAKPPTYPRLKIKYPNIEPVGIQLVEPQYKLCFEVGDNLEVLCNDSGMKGCWLRCKVLQVSQKRMKVQYDDIRDCDSLEKLEEWVPSYKVAGSDKFGMRCTGRLTVRPRPLEDSSVNYFELGAAVDAWWSNGWWEGVVTGFGVSGSGDLQVYFPGENILLEIQRKNVRTSREWVDDKWAEVERKKDINSFISSSLTCLSSCGINEPGNCENQMAPRLVVPEDNKLASTSKHSAEKQDTNVLKLKKRWMDTDNHVFISWEEHVVSQGKGRRVVHYYLKDTSGELILAVMGTERSTRHILYVVSEDYLDAFGHTSTVNSDTKWRTRKEVEEWLTFLISKHHQSPPISDTPRSEKRRSALMAGHISDEVSKNITREDPSAQGYSGSRSVDESSHSGIRKSIPGNQIAKSKPPTCPKLKIKFPSVRPAGIQLVEPQNKLSFEIDDNLEVLCNDSGMRGCWFRCKVLQVLQKRLKVQYDDIQDCDGPEKLEEWIPFYKVAVSDKLGMRCTGRLTVRPRPLVDSSDYSFEVGAAVDAWWSDGWWEGVVAGFDVCGSDQLQVYFPGENILLETQRENVRTSRDWVDDKWVEVEGKKDIKSFISSS